MKNAAILIVATVAVCLAGCVERKLTLTSEPEGARVFVSDVEVGRTPVTIPFTWYGDYDIIYRFEEGGYGVKRTHAYLGMPAYEIPPFDLLSQMAPWWYRDHRYVHCKLTPQTMPSDTELIRRAEAMQRRNLEGEKK